MSLLENIPDFGIGTYTLIGDECLNIVSEGLKIGYKLIDTAELYNNHDQISRALKSVSLSDNIKSAGFSL
jgi:diketogulonate reductase-like aldo/keto reductase